MQVVCWAVASATTYERLIPPPAWAGLYEQLRGLVALQPLHADNILWEARHPREHAR
jgi:hypothetical protein